MARRRPRPPLRPTARQLFLGAVLARGRRAVTTWIGAAKLSGRFQSCYIAVAVDALGNPVEFLLTPGQEADVTRGAVLIADKGYDSDPLVSRIEGRGAKAVIPPEKNRKSPRDYDEQPRPAGYVTARSQDSAGRISGGGSPPATRSRGRCPSAWCGRSSASPVAGVG